MSVAYKPRLYTKVFVQFAMANLFTVSSFGIFFIFPLYLKDKGGTEADIGIIIGDLCRVICSLPTVDFGDNRPARKET